MFQCLRDKSVVFWFCKVVCLHMQGEVRQFGTLRCVIHSWLIWCKHYRNRSIFSNVVAKCLWPRFFMPTFLCPTVYMHHNSIWFLITKFAQPNTNQRMSKTCTIYSSSHPICSFCLRPFAIYNIKIEQLFQNNILIS